MNPHTQKDSIRNAQAKHLSTLFGDDAPSPLAQAASEQQRTRAAELTQAAERKKAALSPDEEARLRDLQRRQEAQVARPAPTPAPAPARTAPTPPRPSAASNLHKMSERNDLASAALRNMRTHSQPKPPPPAPRPTPVTGGQPPAPRTTRPAPRPEELERMLKELAGRPRPGGRPERGEAGAAFEAAPEPPPETPPEDQPEYNEKKQAEIVEKLKATESQVQQHTPHIPAGDQERAVEGPVEASIPAAPIKNNAVDSSEYYQALETLQKAMKAHDPVGQVEGINQVQRSNPDHPLSDKRT